MSLEPPVLLLAEDTGAIRMMLCEVFEDEGYTVTGCVTAAEAIVALHKQTPSLVISDMQMEHVVAGLSLLREIRHHVATVAVPVIIYSANVLLLETLQPQLEALNAVVVHKPFDIDSIIVLAQRMIELK